VSTQDLRNEQNFPQLKRRAAHSKSLSEVAEVLGSVNERRMSASIAENCDIEELRVEDYSAPPAHLDGKPALVRIGLSANKSMADNGPYNLRVRKMETDRANGHDRQIPRLLHLQHDQAQ
jgi:hypothetical protein